MAQQYRPVFSYRTSAHWDVFGQREITDVLSEDCTVCHEAIHWLWWPKSKFAGPTQSERCPEVGRGEFEEGVGSDTGTSDVCGPTTV